MADSVGAAAVRTYPARTTSRGAQQPANNAPKQSKPAPNIPPQSDPVDARDLTRRLELYVIELQLRAQSRPGRSPSPPPRKKPPPDTPSSTSSLEESPWQSPPQAGHVRQLSRPNSMMPEAFAHSVEFHRVESRRASAIIVTRPKGPARPNSINPAFAAANGQQLNGLASRRSSQHFAQTLPQVPNDVPALPPPQIGLPEVWQAPKTTEEAAVALAALAEREERLREQFYAEQRLKAPELNQRPRTAEGQLKPTVVELDQRPRTTETQLRPLTADSNRPTTSGTVESDLIPTTAHSPEQAAVDVVLSPAPGAVKAVQVGKPILNHSSELQVIAVTREGSMHSSASKENKPPVSPGSDGASRAAEDTQAKAEKERLEQERAEKEKKAARKAEQEKVLADLQVNVRNSPTRPVSTASNKRKSTASINRKSTSTINLIMADVPLTPSMPSLPSSPGFPPSGSPAPRRGDFDEKAFLAKMRTPFDEQAAKEADRRSRSMSTTSQLNHRISQHSIKGRKTPISSRPGSAHGSVSANEVTSAKTPESKRGKELRMRNNAVKQAGAPHLNAAAKPLAGEGKKKKGANGTSTPDVPQERSASRANGRKTPTSGASTQTPSILKKTTKSPANSRPSSRSANRPPSRSATLASATRSRANSTATTGAGGSVIAGIKSQPLPQTEFTVQSAASLKKQKSLTHLTSKDDKSQAPMTAYRFPEIAHDDPARAASPFLGVGLGLNHSNSSLNNFSRPNSSSGRAPTKSAASNLASTGAVVMPAPPDPVYRSRSRMNRHGSVDSTRAGARSMHSVRSFTNDASERSRHKKRVSIDQTGNMTDASLKLLAKMEEELARRGGTGTAMGGDDAASFMGPSRGPSRLGRGESDGRSESRMTVEKGGYRGGSAEDRESWEKDEGASVTKKKSRGCLGCLGR